MADIALSTATTIDGELILSERKVTNEFIVIEIVENCRDRFVRAEIELGPFVTEETFGGSHTRGSSRRGIMVWSDNDYNDIELIWDNTMLITKITELLEAEAAS